MQRENRALPARNSTQKYALAGAGVEVGLVVSLAIVTHTVSPGFALMRLIHSAGMVKSKPETAPAA